MQKVCTKRVCLTSLHCKHKILLPSCCLCPWDISPIYRDALCAIPWGITGILDPKSYQSFMLPAALFFQKYFCGFYFYRKLFPGAMPACVHIWATDFGFVWKMKKKFPFYTLRGEGEVLCGKVLKGAAQGYLIIIRGKFFIVYHVLVNLSPWYSPFETICRNRNDVHFSCWKHLYFHPALFFFNRRLQLHKIKRFRRLFPVYFYKSSDLGAQTPPILLIDVVFGKGSLQQARKVLRLAATSRASTRAAAVREAGA